jgi:tetratricopeptide (TPR) repeat protein
VPDLSATHADLPTTAKRMYLLLGGVHPGPDVTVPAAAALAELSEADAETALETLTAVQLVRRRKSPGGLARYRLSDDAVRAHAGDVGLGDPEQGSAEALRRLTEWYRSVCVAVAKTCNPGRWYLGPGYDTPPIIDFASQRAALDWVAAERGNLRSVTRAAYDAGLYAAAWQIVEGQWPWYTRTRAASDCIDDHTLAHQAAIAEENPLAQARMLEGRAWGHLTAGNLHDAVHDAQAALELEEEHDHLVGQATAVELTGLAHLLWDKPEAAAAQFLRARELHLSTGRPRGAALVTRHLGEASHAAGRHFEAIGHYNEALAFFDRFGHEGYHQARTLNHLARALTALDRTEEAMGAAQRALAITEDIGAPNEEAISHMLLADLAADSAVKQRHLDAAAGLVDGLDGTEAEQIRQRLRH